MMTQSRYFVSARDLNCDDTLNIFDRADFFEKNTTSTFDALKNKIIATVFFEPSTRSQLGFQSAVHSLSGNLIHTSSILESRSNSIDSECILDALSVISFYCDGIIFRSNRSLCGIDLDSLLNNVLLINAGDGGNEHPVQALSDFWLISKYFNNCGDISFGFLGDCQSRVFTSMFYMLVKFGVKHIHYYSTNAEKLPASILVYADTHQVELRFHDNICSFLAASNVIELIPYRIPHHNPIQKNSSKEVSITATLIESINPEVFILHPGPRNFEMCKSTDQLKNSLFYRQAEKGIYMKMAVLEHFFSQ